MPADVIDPGAERPRVVIAALSGSGGKTLVSLGLTAAWRKAGLAVTPFKKGADYIDAGWLAAAAGQPCRNLDLFMVDPEDVRSSFLDASSSVVLSVIEGNRGLYDGMNVEGTYSAAALAKLIEAPVILVCNASKTTRTLAALVLGCQHFDPQVQIRGIVLNRVAGRRHESILRDSVDRYCGVPVVGAIPRLPECPFPERHLGLVPPQEHVEVPAAIQAAAQVAEEYLDLDAIQRIARAAPPLSQRHSRHEKSIDSAIERPHFRDVRIGVLRDDAFQFYYPENLEALERAGGCLIEASPLADERLPEVDAIYIGGGFPETLAERLAGNRTFRLDLAAAVESGLPVYAECAGAVYLGETLEMGERTYPMSGAMPVRYHFESRPQGHGYAEMAVTGKNPFFEVGESFRGHEFHYTRVRDLDESELTFAFRVRRGTGVDGERDGICRKNSLATYCHLHALGVKGWAQAIVRAGAAHRRDTGTTQPQ